MSYKSVVNSVDLGDLYGDGSNWLGGGHWSLVISH
jgi:hypothetical protein